MEIEFVSKFGPERVREGGECVLKCALNVVPESAVEWYRGDTQITFDWVRTVKPHFPQWESNRNTSVRVYPKWFVNIKPRE